MACHLRNTKLVAITEPNKTQMETELSIGVRQSSQPSRGSIKATDLPAVENPPAISPPPPPNPLPSSLSSSNPVTSSPEPRPVCSTLENISSPLASLFSTLDARPVDDEEALKFLTSESPFNKELLSQLSSEELKIFAFKVVKLVGCYQCRTVKKNGGQLCNGFDKWRFACSRSGNATQPAKVVKLTNARSARCGCPFAASFNTNPDVLEFSWNLQHTCDPLDEAELYQQKLPEGEVETMVKTATSRMKGNPGLAPKDHIREIDQACREAGVLREEEKMKPAFGQRLIKEARKKLHGNVRPHDSLEACVEALGKGGYDFKLKLTTVEGEEIVDAISFSDPELRGENVSDHFLFMADVSFNLIDKNCGFAKVSSMLAVDLAHNVNTLVTSVISHEDKDTFETELQFYIDTVDPTLPSRDVVFIVDGDRGRIAAIRNLLPRAKIYLCIWHKQENLKSHFGSELRQNHLSIPKIKLKIQALNQKLGTKVKITGNKNELVERLVELSALDVTELSLDQVATLAKELGETNDQSPSNVEVPSEVEFTVDNSLEELRAECRRLKLTYKSGSKPMFVERISKYKSEFLGRQQAEQEAPQVEEEETDTTTLPSHIHAFNPTTVKQVFDYIRTGVDRADTLKRLEEVKARFPSKSRYIDEELVPTMQYWADFHNVWCMSFGLRAAALMEGTNWSLKAPLNKQTVPLQSFPGYVRTTMKRRTWTVKRKQQISDKPLPQLLDLLSRNGFARLSQVFQYALSREAQSMLLSEFEVAQGYVVREIISPDIELLIKDNVIPRRGAIANRFTMILGLSELKGRFFLVTRMASETKDLVHVASCSSLGCTCGENFEMAYVCRHGWAVFRSGYIGFNPVSHLHPLYYANRDVLSHLAFESFTVLPPSLSIQESVVRPSPRGSPLAHVVSTEDLWRVKGMGIVPTALSASMVHHERSLTASADRGERAKKMFYEMLQDFKKDEELFVKFYKLFIEHQDARSKSALLDAKARGLSLIGQPAKAGGLVQPAAQTGGKKKRIKSSGRS